MSERLPWTDGIEMKSLWNKSKRNKALWDKIVEARKELIAKAIAWRGTAVSHGWVCTPTYQNEPVETAFTLHRFGFVVHGLARPATDKTLGVGTISACAVCAPKERAKLPSNWAD